MLPVLSRKNRRRFPLLPSILPAATAWEERLRVLRRTVVIGRMRMAYIAMLVSMLVMLSVITGTAHAQAMATATPATTPTATTDATTDTNAAMTTGRVLGPKPLQRPDWFKESFLQLQEDVVEAAELGKHVILMMDMEGCPYCYKMLEENFAHAPYRDFIQEHFEVIALNIRGDLPVEVTTDLTLPEREVAAFFGARFTPAVVFLDAENQMVARVNGYRNVEDFKRILDFVQERAYQIMTLHDYLHARQSEVVYALQEHPHFVPLQDLSRSERPLAVLFEDTGCVACLSLHQGHLADAEVRQVLERMTVVRLDARAETPIVDPAGQATTPQAWAEALGIQYRPSIVLFDQGREIARIESMLYRYHFTGILEYVADRHYHDFPRSPFAYINDKTARLTTQGIDVRIADE
jgi:thioredoxin-related protein